MADPVRIGTVEIIRMGDHWEVVFSCTLTIPTPKDGILSKSRGGQVY